MGSPGPHGGDSFAHPPGTVVAGSLAAWWLVARILYVFTELTEEAR